jgi:hypothetical protein
MKQQRSKFLVSVRLRPILRTDFASQKSNKKTPSAVVHVKNDGQTIELLQEQGKVRSYRADHAFDHNTHQHELYNLSVKPIINDFLHGYDATCISYGSSSSGKCRNFTCILSFLICTHPHSPYRQNIHIVWVR